MFFFFSYRIILFLYQPGWTMVFKAVSGGKGVAYENYKSGETYAENEMAALHVTNQYP